MKHAFLGIFIAFALVGAGCGKSPTNTNSPTVNSNTPPTNASGAVENASSSTPAAGVNTNTPIPAATAPAAGKPKPAATATKTSFYVEADDSGFYPGSGTARKGSNVTVTFKIRTSNVIYNGLQIKSNKYDLGKIQGGSSKSIIFPAEANVTFSSFWPTGAYRGAWTLYVK